MDGPTYTWYRAVANSGRKSAWSNSQLVKKDSYFTTLGLNGGEFTYTGNTKLFELGYYIPVDTSKTYRQTMTIKTSDASAVYLVGVREYDVDYNLITADNVMYYSSSTTYLKQDLKPGDTVVYLNSTSGFNTTATAYYQLGFTFWNYTDSTGYTYPKGTYSRNVYMPRSILYNASGINKTNNTITLNAPWTGPNISAGTYVSQSNSGSNYNYGITSSSLPTSYQTLTNTISGVCSDGGSCASNKFKPGTKYIKILLAHNYQNKGSSNTTTSISSWSFEEVK